MTERSRTPDLSADDRRNLLRLARATLEAAAGAFPSQAGTSPPHAGPGTSPDELAAGGAARILDLPAAAFVTLQEAGELRGCMGILEPDRPLRETVVEAATSAALRDPRFWPVERSELDRITVEVTVLGPMVVLDDPLDFDPPTEGVVVERGARRALLLPQVARERGWDARTTLEAVCHKAGLPGDAWRLPGTRVLAFGAVLAVEGEDDAMGGER
ncbi:MAG: AmmeMemoRadiSam system protein A [Chloroflexi bacterium]|nr:AmmeMemoRadiSam system protein A [Chloroflexota bacterium]